MGFERVEWMTQMATEKVMLPISSLGVRSFAELEEAERAAAILHDGGHAYILDLVFSSSEKFLEARVHHYLTCERCRREKESSYASQ